jgi:AraC family transcriptional regulator of adaptative response / DNA-3-methyladenine glycosylase II
MLERLGMTRDVLDRARRSRDARFDGKFFIAVTSTGIYCRSICPAKTSKDANVRYYATAAEAAEAGFRPCRRCRPETAPGSPAWLGTSAVVRRALRMIQEGALDEASVEALALRLGVGARHLGRLFNRHVGVSPVAVARTRRLHFAKQLLDETGLPITQIALASGFGSVRRFNAAFKATYLRSPREIRKATRPALDVEIRLRLTYRPPYDWACMSRALARQAIAGLERVSAESYQRTVRVAGGHARLEVRPLAGADALQLCILGAGAAELLALASAARRMFDLSADPARITEVLQRDPQVGHCVALHPGLRIPGAWDPFESAVRALISRDGSAADDTQLLAALVERSGTAIGDATGQLRWLFPTAQALARADPLRLGCPPPLAARICGFAAEVSRRSAQGEAPVDAILLALQALAPDAPDLAEHVALFGLGDPDALPFNMSVLRGRLAARPLTNAQLQARTESWRPFRGYAGLHLTAETERYSRPSFQVRTRPVPDLTAD